MKYAPGIPCAPGGSKALAETPTNIKAQLLLRVRSVHLDCIFIV